MYLTASRPDIMFAVSACARNQVSPTTSNLLAVKRIFKYLKAFPKLGLWYPRDSPFHLEAFSDSDYAGAAGDRKSTTGGCQYLGRRLISWQCKKQTIVATSSCEAEYVAAASCCGQWLAYKFMAYGKGCGNSMIRWLALYQNVDWRFQLFTGLATPELMATGKETSNHLGSVDDSLPSFEVMRPTQQGQAGWLLLLLLLSSHPCSTSVVHSYSVAVNPPGAEDIDLLLETGQ
ncbi:hypothetical protein Tco_0385558 [Tanacetum coccineum]